MSQRERGAQFVRQWRLLVSLRRGPKTLTALSGELDCCERTVRRDLEVLQAVSLPIVSERTGDDGTKWGVLEMLAWPFDSVVPGGELPRKVVRG
jgi:hypothetical protein